MIPKKMKSSGQKDLFRSRVEQVINRKHPLCRLAQEIDGKVFEEAFGPGYEEGEGRPGDNDSGGGRSSLFESTRTMRATKAWLNGF